LVKIHWRMLILVFTRMLRSTKIWSGDLDLWPWKSIGFQIQYPTGVHIFILGSCNVQSFMNFWLIMQENLQWQSAYWIVSKFLSPKRHNRGKTQWTIKILYTAKFTHHGLKFHKVWWKSDKRFGSWSGHTDGQKKTNLTWWPWPLTLKINRVPDSLKD
jgi:hypothetical protein